MVWKTQEENRSPLHSGYCCRASGYALWMQTATYFDMKWSENTNVKEQPYL